MAMRRTGAKLCTVMIQPLYYAGVEPGSDVPGFRKAGKGNQGLQGGTASAPASFRPFHYDSPTYLPYWHHVADIWRPEQKEQSFPGEHACTTDGDFSTSAELIAVRPLLEDIFRHRTLENGVAVALERWEGVKKGHAAGIFNDECLHRAGFYVLDVMAEHKDMEGGELFYSELHDPPSKGGLGLPFDATHVEKMVLLGYRAEAYTKASRYFEEGLLFGAERYLKTQTFAIAMACYGRELEAKKAVEAWNKWIFLERDVHTFPYYQLAECVMGAVDDAELEQVKLILRNFNDFYIERVWEACLKSGMDNEQMVYYTEWLFKSRRHVMLNPEQNHHFLQYALHRVTISPPTKRKR
eukprot:TRINITY_DN27046_c0_g1_i1.p1 TRINITY_DN27046_c0_g1~~TRINITY_DN27046_c0_g1_i1.p1  ORF type:complete len:353 (+),score=105.28 TRINITY_DN27046_c0_g1_i1:71-1129(+)